MYRTTYDEEYGEEYIDITSSEDYDEWSLSVKAEYHGIQEYETDFLEALDKMLLKIYKAIEENSFYNVKEEMEGIKDCFCHNGEGWEQLGRYSTIEDEEYPFEYESLLNKKETSV